MPPYLQFYFVKPQLLTVNHSPGADDPLSDISTEGPWQPTATSQCLCSPRFILSSHMYKTVSPVQYDILKDKETTFTQLLLQQIVKIVPFYYDCFNLLLCLF